MPRKDESPTIAPKAERKRKHRNYRKDKHKEEFSDISDEDGGGGTKSKSVSKYASVASSFIEAVESATIKGTLQFRKGSGGSNHDLTLALTIEPSDFPMVLVKLTILTMITIPLLSSSWSNGQN
jgi:hypothetical protein